MQLNTAISTTVGILAVLTLLYFPAAPVMVQSLDERFAKRDEKDIRPASITLPLQGRERWEFEDALVACLRRDRDGKRLPEHVLKAMASEFTHRLNKHRDLRKAVSFEAYKDSYADLQRRLVSLAILNGEGRNARDLADQRAALYSLYKYMNISGYRCARHQLARMRQKNREQRQ